MTDTQAAPRRRKPWLIALPLILVVILGAGWSGLWFYAAGRAERELDAWIAREALLGRVWNCAERSLGGFPFRFELLCRAPSLVTQGTGDSLRITTANAHVVAQVWAPNHMVAEFASPARVEDVATGHVYGATWSLLQMSGVGDMTGRPQRISLAVDNLAVQFTPDDPTAAPLFTAKHFEAHARRSPAGSNAGPDGVDYAVGLVDGQSATLASAGTAGPINLVLQGSVSAVDNLQPMSVEERLRAWAAANGVLKVNTFQLTTPKAALSASGALGINPEGRLFGAVNLGFAGVDELVRNLARSGIIGSEMATIIGAVAMAGKPGDVAGRKGATFAITLKDGTVQLGRFPVGIIPPLF